MKPKEFTLRKLVNNRTTIKTQDGSFKGSGGEVEVAFTFGEDVKVDEAIEYTKKKARELQDEDEQQWLRQELEPNNKIKEAIEIIDKLNKENKKRKEVK
jgi:hypothetical protein